jgi:hypothetical protein
MYNAHLILHVIHPFYCCLIRWTCTSACPVTLRWLLDANSPLPPPTLLLPERRGWRSWSLPISVPISPTMLHSNQRGCCFVACFSLLWTGPNTCLLVFPLLATIYHWWNLGLSGETMGPKPSFSAMDKWTYLRRAFPYYGTPCVLAKSLLGSQVQEWCISAERDSTSPYGSSISRFSIHFLNPQDINYLSCMFSVVQQQMRDYILALQDVLPYVTATLTSVTYVDPAPDANKNINFLHLNEELIHFV